MGHRLASRARGRATAEEHRPTLAEGVAAVVRLAAGVAPGVGADADWAALLALAKTHRLAALAWLRGGETLRALAPAPLVAEWRNCWLTATLRAQSQLRVHARLGEALAAAGVRAVTLKGMPLSQRLYGDPAVRCSGDWDVYVDAAERDRLTRVLEAEGWERVEGEPPFDETFRLRRGPELFYLEVHSSLLGERLASLPLPPPDAALAAIDGRDVLAHTGPTLPGYLAVHLATHSFPPALWWVDFHTLWQSMGDAERASAVALARRAGVHRYLDWALRRSAGVQAMLDGDPAGARRLGFVADRRRDVHQLWRHLLLAPGPGVAAAALTAWVRPRWAPADRSALALLSARMLRHWRALLPASRGADPRA
ncbi:MAG: nucleotidyltransferase family protein [Gemmatimonadaceae bacterium]